METLGIFSITLIAFTLIVYIASAYLEYFIHGLRIDKASEKYIKCLLTVAIILRLSVYVSACIIINNIIIFVVFLAIDISREIQIRELLKNDRK